MRKCSLCSRTAHFASGDQRQSPVDPEVLNGSGCLLARHDVALVFRVAVAWIVALIFRLPLRGSLVHFLIKLAHHRLLWFWAIWCGPWLLLFNRLYQFSTFESLYCRWVELNLNKKHYYGKQNKNAMVFTTFYCDIPNILCQNAANESSKKKMDRSNIDGVRIISE